ncbi:Dimethyladenosine transferase [Orbilia blumenaviensis]|uniref:rRNA adenine N(6)-methyltransferase n=1 Tax=Orbilia blumenaviensis TaxID=1796055 RepID=A0AAV9VEX3_9PEZI
MTFVSTASALLLRTTTQDRIFTSFFSRRIIPTAITAMPKEKTPKRNFGGSGPSNGRGGKPYSGTPAASAAAKVAHNIFKMNKDIGQHILINPGIVDRIIDKAALKQSDVVLEVGPGTGNLTMKILENARKVVAVEMDPRMAAELTKRVQGKPVERKLELMLGDVIKTELPYFDVCISNTPYQISSPLVFKLLALPTPPRMCVLMFQKEFADRLTAQPGDAFYSRLSANVQMWSKVTHVMKVGKGNFKPPPQVESAVVKIEPKFPRPTVSYEEWDGMLRILFIRKNKTISAVFGLSTVQVLIERNYRTWCAQNDIPLDTEEDGDVEMGGEVEEVVADNDVMEGLEGVDDDDLPRGYHEIMSESRGAKKQGKRKYRGKVAELVRSKVKRVLEETDLANRRAAKCDQGDFLNLLYSFNKEGIHFN